MKEEKSEAVEILKDVLIEGLAKPYLDWLKQIEEYKKLKAEQKKKEKAVLELLKTARAAKKEV